MILPIDIERLVIIYIKLVSLGKVFKMNVHDPLYPDSESNTKRDDIDHRSDEAFK